MHKLPNPGSLRWWSHESCGGIKKKVEPIDMYSFNKCMVSGNRHCECWFWQLGACKKTETIYRLSKYSAFIFLPSAIKTVEALLLMHQISQSETVMQVFISSRNSFWKCILGLYSTENRENRVSEVSQRVAKWAKAWELRNQRCREKQKTLSCYLPRLNNSWGSQVSHASDKDLEQVCMFSVYRQFGSHTEHYTRRQHTSGTEHDSAPHYDTLRYSMVHAQITSLWGGQVVSGWNIVMIFTGL